MYHTAWAIQADCPGSHDNWPVGSIGQCTDPGRSSRLELMGAAPAHQPLACTGLHASLQHPVPWMAVLMMCRVLLGKGPWEPRCSRNRHAHSLLYKQYVTCCGAKTQSCQSQLRNLPTSMQSSALRPGRQIHYFNLHGYYTGSSMSLDRSFLLCS